MVILLSVTILALKKFEIPKTINNSISLLANNTNMNLNDKLITVQPLLILQRPFLLVQTNNFVVLRGNKQYQKLVLFTFKSIYRSQLKLLGHWDTFNTEFLPFQSWSK